MMNGAHALKHFWQIHKLLVSKNQKFGYHSSANRIS